MLTNTITKIEEKIKNSNNLETEIKNELSSLISQLKSEVITLSETHPEQVQSILGFTGTSAHEVTRKEKNPHLLSLSLKALAASIEGFEESHPKLVKTVNSICNTLSNMGI